MAGPRPRSIHSDVRSGARARPKRTYFNLSEWGIVLNITPAESMNLNPNLNLNLKWYFALLRIFEARLEYIGIVVHVTEFVNGVSIENTMKS